MPAIVFISKFSSFLLILIVIGLLITQANVSDQDKEHPAKANVSDQDDEHQAEVNDGIWGSWWRWVTEILKQELKMKGELEKEFLDKLFDRKKDISKKAIKKTFDTLNKARRKDMDGHNGEDYEKWWLDWVKKKVNQAVEKKIENTRYFFASCVDSLINFAINIVDQIAPDNIKDEEKEVQDEEKSDKDEL